MARFLTVLSALSCWISSADATEPAADLYTRGYRCYQAGRLGGAKALFEHLAAEEQNHYSLLKNTYDFMSDPEGFDGFDGNAMLDGG